MENQAAVRFPDKSEIAAFVIGAFPFVCNFTTSSRSTVNGQVVNFQQTDFIAIAAGAVCVVATLSTLRLWGQTSERDRLKRTGVFVALLALGAFQVLRGLGVFVNVP